MGILRAFPTNVLEGINDAGAYYYACYLTLNICKYKQFVFVQKFSFIERSCGTAQKKLKGVSIFVISKKLFFTKLYWPSFLKKLL